jgi:hypothetical protein
MEKRRRLEMREGTRMISAIMLKRITALFYRSSARFAKRVIKDVITHKGSGCRWTPVIPQRVLKNNFVVLGTKASVDHWWSPLELRQSFRCVYSLLLLRRRI